MAEIKQGSLADLREERAQVLLFRHWEEISHYPDIPLEINWPVYEAAEAGGKFRLFLVRVDGEIAGYAAYFVNHNPRYMSSLQAVQDVIFLAPEHRGGTLGYRLIAFADKALAAEGCQCVYQHQKNAHPALGRLLEAQGYEAVETIWAKRLDRTKG